MSTLLVDELFPGLTFVQRFRITRDVNLAHVRPWVYIQGTIADGELQCEIKQGTTVLATSTLTAAEINSAKTETYAHGFIRMDFDSLALRVAEGDTETEYIAEFSMINHTKDEANFLGISRSWEDPIYEEYETPLNDSVSPAGIEFFDYDSI